MIQNLIDKYINNPVTNTNNNKILGAEKYEGYGNPASEADEFKAQMLINEYIKNNNQKKTINDRIIEDKYDEYGFAVEEEDDE